MSSVAQQPLYPISRYFTKASDMRPALKLLQRGFLKRSIDEIRTQAHGSKL